MLTQVLSHDQVQRLHTTALTILESVGVTVPHEEMLRRFADSGARVDFSRHHVNIPSHLVMDLLAGAGKTFTLYGRDISRTAAFGQGCRNYNSSAGQASWVESLGGPRRYATLADVASAARIGDALPWVNVVGAMADPHELPITSRCVEVLATMLKQTVKPLTFWYHDRATARYINEMLIAVRGSEAQASSYPLCYPLLEPISPLRFPLHGIDLLFETARLNLPVPVGPMAQMGLTAPMSLAGTMAQQTAEIIAGICITQLIRPGMPVCFGGICHAFDMGTTQLIFGGPEQTIYGVAMTQMGKFYGLPVYVNSGLTDAKCADAQAGLEAGMTLLASAAAGADIFGHFGIAGVDQGASLEMLVLQHEIMAYVESAMREVELTDEAIGLEVIREGAQGGTFIDHEHTVAHLRRELWFPSLLDRRYYQAWLDDGAPTLADRCRDRVQDILRMHSPEPLLPELEREIDAIVRAAKSDLAETMPYQ